MKLTTLKATSRVSGSSRATARLRKAGEIPATYYGKGQESVSISVNAIDVSKILAPGKRYTLLDLEIDGKAGHPAVVYTFQKDNIANKITHIDFFKIDDKTPLKVRIPIVLKGLPVGVKTDGGLLAQESHYIFLSADVNKIPSKIEIDISDFHAGTTYYAKELALPEGNMLVSPLRTVVFTISTKAKAAKEEAAAAALLASAAASTAAAAPAAGAEGAAAPAAGAEGAAAPAAGAAAPAADAAKAKEGGKK
ncbi:MAG: 50S ribosomal protein L25 [Fibrobacteraceae bacterium]